NAYQKHAGGAAFYAAGAYWFIGGTDGKLGEQYTTGWFVPASRTTSRTGLFGVGYGSGIMISGGADQTGKALSSSEVLTGTSAASGVPGPAMFDARIAPTTLLLPSGRTVVSGGVGASGAPIATTEAWDPNELKFIALPAMKTPRTGHALVRLSSGTLFAIGG